MRRISKLPNNGGYCPVLSQEEFLGGEAANTASFLVMWRQEVVLAGNGLGMGMDYENIRLRLLERGLDVDYLVRSDLTPVCDVYVTDDGDRTMFGLGFDSKVYTPLETIPFQAGEWFTADPNLSFGGRAAARMAYEKGMKLYLMDFFAENEQFPKGSICQYGTDWVGARGDNDLNKNWVVQWSKSHKIHSILTDGVNGTHVSTAEGDYFFFPAFKAESVVDSTGAGDAFRAGTIYGLSNGWDLGRSIRFGSAAAALKVPHMGAAEYLPSFQEVKDFIFSQPEIASKFELKIPQLHS